MRPCSSSIAVSYQRTLRSSNASARAVMILLLLTFVTAVTGVIRGGLIGGDWARSVSEFHEAVGSLLQFLVFVHIGGVLVDWALTRDNLIAAMWHGRKRIDEASAALDARGGGVWLATVIAVPLMFVGAYILTQIDLTEPPSRHALSRYIEDSGNSR